MGKIFYLMGKSSTGKDTIYKFILKENKFKLRKIVPYTTRPIREGEENGREYNFIDDAEVERLGIAGKIIELRAYNTFHGTWRYMTVDDGRIKLDSHNYIIIGTLESYKRTVDYYGQEAVVPIMVEVDNGVRLQRALNRERNQENPKYQEMCRRFLADEEDFSPERMKEANITKIFVNDNLTTCISEIEDYIEANLEPIK
ncbi:MAG: guanylate kinase [Lachnospiraceae bacterium]|nr:guanylate kinase [Lachnospiraceae bacterium]